MGKQSSPQRCSIPSEDNSKLLRLNLHREGNMEAKRKVVEL